MSDRHGLVFVSPAASFARTRQINGAIGWTAGTRRADSQDPLLSQLQTLCVRRHIAQLGAMSGDVGLADSIEFGHALHGSVRFERWLPARRVQVQVGVLLPGGDESFSRGFFPLSLSTSRTLVRSVLALRDLDVQVIVDVGLWGAWSLGQRNTFCWLPFIWRPVFFLRFLFESITKAFRLDSFVG